MTWLPKDQSHIINMYILSCLSDMNVIDFCCRTHQPQESVWRWLLCMCLPGVMVNPIMYYMSLCYITFSISAHRQTHFIDLLHVNIHILTFFYYVIFVCFNISTQSFIQFFFYERYSRFFSRFFSFFIFVLHKLLLQYISTFITQTNTFI